MYQLYLLLTEVLMSLMIVFNFTKQILMNCRVMRLMGPHRLPMYLFGGILKENVWLVDIVYICYFGVSLFVCFFPLVEA